MALRPVFIIKPMIFLIFMVFPVFFFFFLLATFPPGGPTTRTHQDPPPGPTTRTHHQDPPGLTTKTHHQDPEPIPSHTTGPKSSQTTRFRTHFHNRFSQRPKPDFQISLSLSLYIYIYSRECIVLSLLEETSHEKFYCEKGS